jgi:CubicO group peptidase (beta-lactamase class C family)
VWALGLLVCVVACASPATTTRGTPAAGEEPAPRFATGGPDAAELGAGSGYPKGDRATYYSVGAAVGSHSHLDEIFPGRLIHKAPTPSRLVRVAEPPITWRFQGADLTLDDYLERNPTTGLLIARGDTILVERYQYGRTDRHRFTSWSMAKTVTAMLVGIAIAEGHIRSVDDLAAAYVPELAGTEYGRTSLRHLLQMSSGVRFSEQYTGSDDVSRLVASTYLLRGAGGASAVTPFNERATAAGTKFSYASVETQVLGLVLRAATNRPPAEYLESRIWQLIGAEADATWLVDTLRAGGHVLLPQRGVARLRASRAAAGSRRRLARPPDHPGGVGHAGDDDTRGSTASVAGRGDAVLRLRLPDVDRSDADPSWRSPDVPVLGRARAADLRRFKE